MIKILILGGYGGFGGRLSTRLTDQGFQILVAGRNLSSARTFCKKLPGTVPVEADREKDLAPLIKEHGPDLIIDAAGPFQDGNYQLVESCIASGVSYIDLADARDFVAGIEKYDEQARAAGVVVISGTSSVPAMSGAIIRALTSDLGHISQIEMAISASSRATVGQSVAKAILSSVGKPVKLWIGRRWCNRTGWHMLRRQTFDTGHSKGLKRTVALVDVPDHQIHSETLKGRPSVIFRAGPEFAFQTAALWILSWPVKWGWIGSLRFLAPLLGPFQRLFARWGSTDSAMQVDVKGWIDGRAASRHWTLIARDGCGPEIPVLAADILVNEIAAGRLTPGAGHGSGQLALEQFERKFDDLAIETSTTEHEYQPLYKRVMGARFDRLDNPIRQMHMIAGDGGANGTATVRRGKSMVARIIASLMRFPPAGDHKLHVSFTEQVGKEQWLRQFGEHSFASELSQDDAYLIERFGVLKFQFHLLERNGGLEMVMRKWSILSCPLPIALAPRSEAREYADDNVFCFDVPIALPLVGLIVHYRGKLFPK